MSSTPTPHDQEPGKFTLDRQDFQQHLEELSSRPAPPNSKSEITAEELLNRKVERIPCLIEPLFHKVGLAAVAGSSDAGKSAFLRQLAFAVATGEPNFLGFPIHATHQSAIYVSTEDDEAATAYLLNSMNRVKQALPEAARNLRFVFDTTDLLAELDRRLTAQPADLIVIDAFGDLYTGDQNKSNQIRTFLNDFAQLAQKHQCLILFLHHTGKRTEDEPPSKHNLNGGQGFEAKMRLVIELRIDHHDPTRRHLCIVKGNYLPAEEKQESHVLRFENFLFEPTGERVPFEALAKPKTDDDRAKRAMYEQAKELKGQGMTHAKIAEKLGYANAGGVTKLLKRFDPPKADVS